MAKERGESKKRQAGSVRETKSKTKTADADSGPEAAASTKPAESARKRSSVTKAATPAIATGAKVKSAGQVFRSTGPAARISSNQGVGHRIEPTDEQIRERAYEYYASRGGAPGDPVADWLQAERELRSELSLAPCDATV